MRDIRDHRDLDAYKKSMELVTEIYKVTKKFPDSEKYGLISQLCRAAVSVPTNISEGAARNSKKEFIQFLYVSLGSLAEIETLLEISNNLNYIKDKNFLDKINTIKKLINGLIYHLKQKLDKPI